MTQPSEDPSSRRLLIVGGGIAGFAMLRACSTRGLQAQLVEASSGPPEVGLGLNLPGNAVRALRALGIADSLRQRAATVRRREYRNARGRLIFAVDEAAYWGEADTPICARRGDVLDLLRASADPGRVRFGHTVTGVAETDGRVQVSFADSATESYDLVVGADGVHSRVRTSVLGAAATRESLLSSASWRFVTVNPGVQCWSVWSGSAGTLLLIPLVADQVYGYASATAGGSVGDDPQWLRSTFDGYPALARQAISSALAEPSSLYHSPIEEVRLESWARGRVVLIGDAAHATAPVWAQGAAQAAEDALVLAELLASGQDWATVGAEFERRRRDRVEHVQRMTDRLSKAAALPGWFRDIILPVVGPRTYRATFDPLKDAVIEAPTS
ncbi:MAG TPA: FAD-dependent monooxygenase [Microlunatus sp.]|jgi:2-polyprenyl-6-methoxyphenol hydroxylase-like FAD-dependent oxidoreductase|nr:FAD-dependent monooxygenase [Microlunatus sp.]